MRAVLLLAAALVALASVVVVDAAELRPEARNRLRALGGLGIEGGEGGLVVSHGHGPRGSYSCPNGDVATCAECGGCNIMFRCNDSTGKALCVSISSG